MVQTKVGSTAKVAAPTVRRIDAKIVILAIAMLLGSQPMLLTSDARANSGINVT